MGAPLRSPTSGGDVTAREKYQPELFVLERAQVASAALGEFIIGVSKLGEPSASAWVAVEAASFSMAAGYSVDDNGTLIVEAETATVSLSYWDEMDSTPLYPSDRVRARYGDKVVFLGTVDSTDVTFAVDPAARAHGATRRVTFSATVAGTYAAALGKKVCWEGLPDEPAIDRIRRWVTVEGW